jgi:hypothetical protein
MLQQKMKINLCERSCVPPPLALAPISFSLIGRAMRPERISRNQTREDRASFFKMAFWQTVVM